MANKQGRGGKLLVGIICFLVGFIVALAAEFGVIAGCVYWLYNSDLADVFDTLGIENTEDDGAGNTNYIYVDTSEITSISALVTQLRAYSDTGLSELTLEEIEDSFPIVGSLVDLVYETIDGAIDSLSEDDIRELIPEDGLKTTKFGELFDYVKDCLWQLKIDTLLDMAGINVEDNVIYLALAYGASGYYYDSSDTLVVTEYKTIADVMENGIDSVFDEIYITDLITATDDNQVFIDAFDGITVGDLLTDGLDITEAMSDIYVTDLLGNEDDLITDIFDGITLGELMEDGLDVDEMLGKIYVPEVMDVSADNGIMAFIGYSLTGIEANSGTLTNGTETISYSHTATLHLYTDDPDGVEYDAYAVTDAAGVITDVYYYENSVLTEYSGISVNEISTQADRLMDTVPIGDMVTLGSDTKLTQKISASTINGIGDVIDELTIVDAMDGVDATSSAVVVYIAYGVSGFEVTGTYTDGEGVTYDVYTGTYHSCTANDTAYDDAPVYLLADGTGEIVGMYADSAYTEEISATLVNDVSDRIDALMNDLPIGDIIDTTGSVILDAISDSTINSLAEDIDNLAIQVVFYDQIYAEVDAANMPVGDAAVDSYLRVVSDTITGGTYYYYTAGTPASLTEVSGDTSSYLAAGTLYWTDGASNAIYQVVEYDEAYLYLNSEFEFVEYETARGHISSANYDTYKSNGVLYTYGKPEGTWYFMLYSDDVECVYSVDHIEALIDNAAKNIENSTLEDLVDTGLITSTYVEENINKTVYASVLYSIYYNSGDSTKADYYAEKAGGTVSGGYCSGTGTVTLGSLTLAETMDLLVYILINGYSIS